MKYAVILISLFFIPIAKANYYEYSVVNKNGESKEYVYRAGGDLVRLDTGLKNWVCFVDIDKDGFRAHCASSGKGIISVRASCKILPIDSATIHVLDGLDFADTKKQVVIQVRCSK